MITGMMILTAAIYPLYHKKSCGEWAPCLPLPKGRAITGLPFGFCIKTTKASGLDNYISFFLNIESLYSERNVPNPSRKTLICLGSFV